jgi:hypothetical protein
MFVYLLTNDFVQFKIGISKNVKKRIKQLQTGNGQEINLIKSYKSEKFYRNIETALHNTYIHKKIKNEWFSLDIDDVNNFENTCKSIENNLIFLENNKI